MYDKVTVRRMGGSLGVTLPKHVADRMQVRERDALYMVETEEGVLLTPCDPDFAEAMEGFEYMRRRYRNAFRELAK